MFCLVSGNIIQWVDEFVGSNNGVAGDNTTTELLKTSKIKLLTSETFVSIPMLEEVA